MHRNITIVVIILILVVIAGYLVWLRSRFQPPTLTGLVEAPEVSIEASPTSLPVQSATPSATLSIKEATTSMKQKTATASSIKK